MLVQKVGNHIAAILAIATVLEWGILPIGASGNSGNSDVKRLYDDLISRYNKLVRPVDNASKPLTVHMKLRLSQLIEVVSCTLN